MVPLSVVSLGPVEDRSCQGEGRPGHDGRLGRYKVPVIEGDLADVSCHVLDLDSIPLVCYNQLCEEVDSWVTDVPLEGVEHVHLHLSEHARVVETAAHVVQFVDLGDPVLLVTVLGGNEQSRAADELVVLLIHHPLGAVPVEQVDGQE